MRSRTRHSPSVERRKQVPSVFFILSNSRLIADEVLICYDFTPYGGWSCLVERDPGKKVGACLDTPPVGRQSRARQFYFEKTCCFHVNYAEGG